MRNNPVVFNLALDVPAINKVIAGLAELPYKDAASTINSIQSQIGAQQKATAAAQQAAKPKMDKVEDEQKEADVKPEEAEA